MSQSKKRKSEQNTKELGAKGPKVRKKELDVKKTFNDQPTRKFTRWLMKSEPESRFEKGIDVKFGIEDLKCSPDQTTCWDGVRNYQARNFMRDHMKIGDLAFFYHSNCKVPGIAGIMEVVKESYVDHTQFDKNDPHYALKSSVDDPKWFMVDVKFVRMTKRFIPLAELKKFHLEHKVSGGPLKSFALCTQARLSVAPVTQEEFDFITGLEEARSFMISSPSQKNIILA